MDNERMVHQAECPECFTWHPSDHEDAQDMGVPAWTTHMLDEHPECEMTQILDTIMLQGILEGSGTE